MRQSRKLEHLKYSVLLADGPTKTGFEDFTLIHNCLPELEWKEINTACSLADISLQHPIIINAITGGSKDVTSVNTELAEFAGLTGLAMAVGSQYSALEDSEVLESYQIVREKNPNGIILANLGAHASAEEAVRAVEMINAQAIQIHLNAGQEIIMDEGDRSFKDYIHNIQRIVAKVSVPVIVKEIGCGIAREQAKILIGIGVKVIDVGGSGGTNFLAIEAARSHLSLDPELVSWGIPTAVAAVETLSLKEPNIDIIVSGGIRTPLDALKALALGAAAVGIAGPVVKVIRNKGVEGAIKWFNKFMVDFKRYMLLTGTQNLEKIKTVPVVISGFSREWLTARGIDITQYARRKY
ncbi:MAG TPA: type 2 isopentenyl-diphosphate Delta-isomerase [Methylomusa anaerophila]|uniref:Isopentenyl-diphosphate delta-isomerase n=1 Tax=Methylomusa anaerophila TaxID=1930071 RepID=A0A348APH6_9FIRM|nr:type 2 isopentenyl-diphosphate Delta-isomerase [Methylomusa anaerophila]BBB92974.1 isopentenyl-diphosphate delta-isomerase [Methylomusa anaerophila]HML87192.1 type 2 isopentenyl-diphosphate Delta-isomerase [Methylomusa anaerophila]